MRMDAVCARLRPRSGCSLRQCSPCATGPGVCRRSGANSSNCGRERRSNARPLAPPNLLALCLRPRDLTVHLCPCAAQPGDYACQVCVARLYDDAMAARARGGVNSGSGGVATAGSHARACARRWQDAAAVGRVRGGISSAPAGWRVLCTRQACCLGPP